ncbi:MAG: primosomal protein N' [Parvularculaceae bacterium]|nr:primosomal protein N' [Parvularculaceae bacterium]
MLPLPLFKPYDYLGPPGLQPGDFVAVPIGGRVSPGVVWTQGGPAERIDGKKLKLVLRRFEAPPLTAETLRFVEWFAHYNMSPVGAVLRLVMRSGDVLEPPAGVLGYRATGMAPARLTPQRAAVLAEATGCPVPAASLIQRSGVSHVVLKGLEQAGALEAVRLDPDPPYAAPDPLRASKELSPAQHESAQSLRRAVREGRGGAILLDGVTGSGKTEVYLEAVAEALSRDPAAQVLILLPEIALTLPFLSRVSERFGAEPAAWHSGIGSAGRRRVWRRVAEGNARLVVGARSALFLPFRKLSLIVVDEEHDGAYKQEDGVIYQARDMAVARAALDKFPVILASATPSLESVVNVDQGRYGYERLPARFGRAQLPHVALIDMRRDGPAAGRWLSPILVEGVNETLARGEQALLFINRRGYAPLTICRRCGHRMKAPHSDTLLVEHRFEQKLVCHHTGFSMPKPVACPACRAPGALAACGPGVERVAEEAAGLWPQARLTTLSSDTAPSASSMRSVLDAMHAGEIDILVATQLVAKGHHFPGLTLVGVVDADLGLAGGDLRAAERTYQLMSQVAGRAGRAEKPGRALIQTYDPGAAVMQALASGDREAFLAAEASSRRALQFPPFGRLVAVILRSRNERVLHETAAAHKAAAPPADGIDVWGPAPAPFYRIRGEARLRFLVRARRDINVQAFVDAWLRRTKLPGSVRRAVDVDPYSFH